MKVAAIVPARNAAHLLRECVDAILTQTRAPDEVVISVAPSSDATRALADDMVDRRVRVVPNLAGDRGSGINVALEAIEADVIAMVDAQSLLATDYLERALAVLEADPAIAAAGGPMRPEGRNAIGRAIAFALQSPFGVGDSQFHFEGDARDVDSVYLGVYRRSAFDQVGHYNPALLRTEDDDLNARIREAGLRIRLDPTIRSRYLCRDSLRGLWSQYLGYGYWKVALATVRPRALRARHLVPGLFTVGLCLCVVAGIAGWWLPAAIQGGLWLLLALAFAISAPPASLTSRLLFPAAAMTMHLAYGVGTLQALLSWSALARRIRAAETGENTGGN